jgi:hypothetical protein
MIPSPWPTLMSAFDDGLERLTKKFSFGSGVVSPMMSIWTTCEFWPCSNVIVPEAGA